MEIIEQNIVVNNKSQFLAALECAKTELTPIVTNIILKRSVGQSIFIIKWLANVKDINKIKAKVRRIKAKEFIL